MFTHACSKVRSCDKEIGPELEGLVDYIEINRPNFIFDTFHFFSANMKNTAKIQEFLMSHSRNLIYGLEPSNGFSSDLTIFMTPSTISR